MTSPADARTVVRPARHIAFLRAINVGGHTVKMDELRRHFEKLGFTGVETFIASGNVVFDAGKQDLRALEKVIALGLKKALGYDVATFLRTDRELTRIAEYLPFPKAAVETAVALNVALLGGAPDAGSMRNLAKLKTTVDDIHVHGREVYWLCRRKQSQSSFSNAVLEKTLGAPSTLRGVNTVKRLAARYGA